MSLENSIHGPLVYVRRAFPATGKALGPFFLLLGLWLIARQYGGIAGDGVLYAGQGLSRLYPEIFRGDIFFAFGSQDDFSLFGGLYAAAISALGLNGASMATVVLGQGLWIYASWRVAGHLPPPQRWIFLALLFTIPGDYVMDVFGYAEGKATARIVAEGLTLMAVAAAFSRQWAAAAVMVAVAVAVHPLMAIWGGALLALWWALHNRKQCMGIALVLSCGVAITLVWTGTASRLWVPMDSDWLALVRERNPSGFFEAWKLRDLNLLALKLCLLAAAWRLQADPVPRRLVLAALLLGLMALGVNLVGAEWLHSQLLIQAQPVRGLWLVTWLAVLAFATLCGPTANASLRLPFFFAIAWFAQDTVGGVIALAVLLSMKRFSPGDKPSGTDWLWGAVAVASWLIHRIANYYDLLRPLAVAGGSAGEGPWETAVLSLGVFTLHDAVIALGGLSAWVLASGGEGGGDRPKRWLLPLMAAAVLGGGMVSLVKSAAHRQVFFAEAAEGDSSHPFPRLIPANATVYWDDNNLNQVWFALGRRSYYSQRQSGGILFSRPSAFEMKRRADHLRSIDSIDAIWTFLDMPYHRQRVTQPTLSGLVALCQDASLDFAVLETAFENRQTAEWTDPQDGKTWRLYDCSRLRGESPAGMAPSKHGGKNGGS